MDTTGRASGRRTPPPPRPPQDPPSPRPHRRSPAEPARSWWLLLGAETPSPPHGCSTPEGPALDCDVRKIRPSDLYCRTHEAFLPLRNVRKPEHPLNPVGLLPRLLVAGLVWTAQFGSPLPIWVLGFLLGAAVLLLPLRRWAVTWRTAAVAWTVTCVLVVAHHWTSQGTNRITATVLLTLTAVAVAVRCAGETMTGASTRVRREASARRATTVITPGRGWVRGTHAAGLIAATLAPVPAVLLFRAVERLAPAGSLTPVPGWARHWIDLAVPAALAGALLATLVAGALQGAGRIDRHVDQLTRPVPKPRRPTWAHPGRTRYTAGTDDLAARLIGVCLRVGEHTLDVLLRTAAFAAGVLLGFGHLCLATVRAGAEWLWRQVVLLKRRTTLSLVMAKDTLAEALPVAGAGTGATLRAVALPIGGLAVAGASLSVLGDGTPGYLTHGELPALWPLLASVACALVALTLAWTGLAGQPMSASANSARHTAETALPHALLTAAATGWAISLPSFLGVGRITPGWLTCTLTAWPLVLVAVHLMRRSREAPHRGRARR
ncbi:hypothetical protein ACIPSE_12065 [Streptomyces sp. NPDC090106]|uniref:hypothetical protein n=1 Tax=Streptomyces sp. NPDC090106 TaxID=3365946 RepID=UPI0038107D85